MPRVFKRKSTPKRKDIKGGFSRRTKIFTDLMLRLKGLVPTPGRDINVAFINESLAKQFVEDLKVAIERQAFAWIPLSKGYARRKNILGLDPRTLIATGAYVNSIYAEQKSDGSWEVTVPEDKQQLAQWLEYGTRRMPARPHWRPAMRLFKDRMSLAAGAWKSSLIDKYKL